MLFIEYNKLINEKLIADNKVVEVIFIRKNNYTSEFDYLSYKWQRKINNHFQVNGVNKFNSHIDFLHFIFLIANFA